MYNCKILLDSISETNKRLTTMEITFPRIVLAEFNTHRMFSRNSASSRAIPFKKQIERVKENPFIPERFPIDGKGMQPNCYVGTGNTGYNAAKDNWLTALEMTLCSVKMLYNSFQDETHIHKQIVNRLLEPFMWHTVIVTATEWDNFFKLRCDVNAQYEIRKIADLMYDEYWHQNGIRDDSVPVPRLLKVGEWHCPLVSEEDEKLILDYITTKDSLLQTHDYFIDLKKRISVARCARVSYLTHDGKRDIEKDLELFERLRTMGHWSPFEHVATPYFEQYKSSDYAGSRYTHPVRNDLSSGNFIGWKQFRKEFQDENCTNFRKESNEPS